MGFRADDRGQSVQVGVVILFGFLIIGLSTYQATVIPAQNTQVEFNHNQDVQDDLIDARNGIIAASTSDGSRPTSVRLGTTYPSRTLFINPPPPTGQLQTVPRGNLTVRNVTAPGDAGDFWNQPRNFSTKAVVYRPGYNEYTNAPITVYSNTVVYNRFDTGGGTNLTVTGQTLVDGDRITLVTLNGSLSTAESGTVTVDPTSISPVTDRVRVEGNITIVVPTSLSAATWQTLLQDQIDAGWVDAVTDARGGSAVAITLNESRTYRLGIARVGVGSGIDTVRTSGYVAVTDAPDSVPVDATREIVVQVRDQYGNPLSGVAVNGSAELGGFANRTVTTNDAGEAVFEYNPSTTGMDTLNFTIDTSTDPSASGFNVSTTANASTTVKVTSSGSRSAGVYTVRWDTTRIKAENTGVTYYASNDTLVVNRSKISPDNVTMFANATDGGEPVSGVNIDFASNNTTVAEFTPSANDTDTTGDAASTMNVSDGVAKVYASANEDGDTLRVKVISAGAAGDDPPAANIVSTSATNTGGDTYEVTVEWEASDPNGDLADGSVTVLDEGPGGNSQTVDIDPSGSSDSGTVTVTITLTGQPPKSYSVELTVSDSNGNSDTDTDNNNNP